MNNEDIEKASEVIRKNVKDGLVPLPIFNVISQTTVLSPVDLYAFIRNGDRLKIIVAKRSDDDEFLAGNWHIPGKIMIISDSSFDDTIERILKTELPGSTMINKPTKFDCAYQSTFRGKEHVASYWVIVDKLPGPSSEIDETTAVSVDNLPEPFLIEQVERVQAAYEAVKDYLANKN